MHEHTYLLFGKERWAILQHYIMRVEDIDAKTSSTPLSLASWGIQTPDVESGGRVLRIKTPSSQWSLLLYGQLKSLTVEPRQVIELPRRFFASSPATALILRDDHREPTLLLDPDRLYLSLTTTGDQA
jgi:hypothetical protein